MKEDTVIRVKNENGRLGLQEEEEEDTSDRQKAGLDFELAADMNSPFLMIPFPQIYLAIGLMVFVCLFSIIFLIIAKGYYYYGGYLFWTILVVLAVFLPDIFDRWWHWLLQAIIWGIYAFCNFIFFILVLNDIGTIEEAIEKSPGSFTDDQKSWLARVKAMNYVNTFLCEPALLVIAFILIRIAVHGLRNR
ncbi:unnamed protein product [Caenorhabditis sp. 36 PRJEB53466]|nr:unnamed protein product [Caenorhabditis sp. 36 PRJEB53466]